MHFHTFNPFFLLSELVAVFILLDPLNPLGFIYEACIHIG